MPPVKTLATALNGAMDLVIWTEILSPTAMVCVDPEVVINLFLILEAQGFVKTGHSLPEIMRTHRRHFYFEWPDAFRQHVNHSIHILYLSIGQ